MLKVFSIAAAFLTSLSLFGWSCKTTDGVFTLTSQGPRSVPGVIRKKLPMPAGSGILQAEIRVTGSSNAYLQAIYRNAKGKVVGWEGSGRYTSAFPGFRAAELPFRRCNCTEVELQLCMASGPRGGTVQFRNVRIVPFKKDLRPLVIKPAFESAALSLNGLSNSDSANFSGTVKFRKKGSTLWLDGGTFVPIPGKGQARLSLLGLTPDTEYETRITAKEGDKEISFSRNFRTLSSTVKTAGEVVLTPEMVKNGFKTSLSGTPEGFLRITAAPGTLLTSAPDAEAVITLDGARYVILKNLTLRGGRNHGIKISNSSNIRVINCDISGYGRKGTQRRDLDGKFYVGKQAVNYDAGIFVNSSSDILVERCFIHAPRGSANPWYFSHPAGPCAMFIQGGEGINLRYNDLIGSDLHRWNDGIEGHNNSSEFGGFRKDAEICGNALLFGNDDGIELDGGQENCRFFNNRIENFLCGISLAPCHNGPSYVIGNRFLFPGDVWGARLAVIKNGFNLLPGGKLIIRNNGAEASFQIGFTGFGSTIPAPGFEKEIKAEVSGNCFGAPGVIDPNALKANVKSSGNSGASLTDPDAPFPLRPWAFTPEKGRIVFTPQEKLVCLKVKNTLSAPARFRIAGVEDHSFFDISPRQGIMEPGKDMQLRLSLRNDAARRLHRGAFSLRLADGRSHVISVYADLTDFSAQLPGIKIANFRASAGTEVGPGMEKGTNAVIFRNGKGGAKAEFYIPETGKYLLFARSNSTGFASVNISFDGKPLKKSAFYRSAGTWGYTPVSANDRGSFFTGSRSHTLSFTKGKHTVRITPRSQAAFDAFYLVPYSSLEKFVQPLTADSIKSQENCQ